MQLASYRDGASFPPLYPSMQSAVLASVAAASGVPTPTSISASIIPLTPQNATVQLAVPNGMRNYLLIYNPTQMVAQFSKGIATQGALGNLSIGPGQAYFTATAQGIGQAYQGPLTAVGLYQPLPLWIWEDGVIFFNDGGVLAFLDGQVPAGWPTSPNGLAPGSVYSNGNAVGIVPGIIPNPTAPKLFLGSITAAQLLLTGGGNLPLTPPTTGSFQLWNNGGEVAIA